MDKRRKGEIWKKRKVSHIGLLLLLALLQTTTALNTTSAITITTTSPPNPADLVYHTRPVDVTVAVGKPAVFLCGVPKAFPNLTFAFNGSHGNYSLTCPNGHVKDEALYGSCDMNKEESLAVWTLKRTSLSDNNTRVVCQQSNNSDAPAAVLHVYDKGISFATLIGCTIGGFFGLLLVFGLFYIMLKRSETLQKCFRGKETEDDMDTIVTKG